MATSLNLKELFLKVKPDLSPNALTVLKKRYLQKDLEGKVIETPEDLLWRVAENIAQADKIYDPNANVDLIAQEFYVLMSTLSFLPNSPTLMNAGRSLQQLSACFVLPIEDSMDSIFEALKYTALIHKSGGGTGFSFSRLRPKKDVVRSTSGISSGPVSFMQVFNAATEAIKQGGTRRGANMGILRIDHPDIMDFITCKNNNAALNNFNISVGITEEFMNAVEEEREYALSNPRTKEVDGYLDAKEVFAKVVDQAWKNGEPGIVFIDRMNKANPTPTIADIESTNPCGEQPLLPYESCNLGSINMAKLVIDRKIDWKNLEKITKTSVHFLDNVIDMNAYPIDKIAEMTRSNRKIGLGIMGWADALIQLEMPYNSHEALRLAEKVMSFIHDKAREESEGLAEKRGAFPNFPKSVFSDGKPRRNATLTTIAPTGTIGIIAGASGGIEPLFAIVYKRSNVLDNNEMFEVNPYFETIAKEQGFHTPELMKKIAEKGSIKELKEIPEKIRRIFTTAHDISPEDHIRVQAAFQKYTDNAVSKTVNFPHDATKEDVAGVYSLAYKLGCKGVTVYRDRSRDTQVLNLDNAKKQEIGTDERKPRGPRNRPRMTRGVTLLMNTGCGKMYVTVNEDEHGACEVFTQLGKSGGCTASQAEAVSRLISLALRSGINQEEIVYQLKGIRCPSPTLTEGGAILSCADAIAKALQSYQRDQMVPDLFNEKKSVAQNEANPQLGEAQGENIDLSEILKNKPPIIPNKRDMVGSCPQCPECGEMLEFGEGCAVCHSCGYSKCW
ncbi:MAG: vitamin B12-dependent ribonucleotide reductase [Elusimicrobia bacterium]|nr:vitamin B12-dependent ribonucleotide reductase [Candidatus Liberimonas magnetica]